MIYPDPELFVLIPAESLGTHRVVRPTAVTVDRPAQRVLLDLGFRSTGLAALNPTAARTLIDHIDLRQPGHTRLPALGRGLSTRVLSLTVHPHLGIDLAVHGNRPPHATWRITLDDLPRLVIALVDAINLVDPYPLPATVAPLRPMASPLEFRRRGNPGSKRRAPHIVRAGG